MSLQLQLGPRELDAIRLRVDNDWWSAMADHERRLRQWAMYTKSWEGRSDEQPPDRRGEPNYRVPVTQWQLYGKWSQIISKVLGEDSEVVAVPVGDSDGKTAAKVGRFMSWRVFDAMNFVNPFLIWTFRTLLYGRAIAYRPWGQRYQMTPQGRQLRYDGPEVYSVHPNDWIVPAERVDSVQDFSWTIRRMKLRPQALLDGEKAGRYFGIMDDYENILRNEVAKDAQDEWQDDIRLEEQTAEGVEYQGGASANQSLRVWEWCGKLRLPKRETKGKTKGQYFDAVSPNDWAKRDMDETDVIVHYLPGLKKIIGVKRISDLYPYCDDPRPYTEMSLTKDGTYWGKGVGELIWREENEITLNHNLGTRATQFSVGPTIFYDPASGFQPDKFTYEPFTAYPMGAGQAPVPVYVKADLSGIVAKEQAMEQIVERVTGVNDQTIGREIDRPNAPKTATGQIALIQMGDIRSNLDVVGFNEDLSRFLRGIWDLDCSMSPKQVFFNVTEEDAGGLFNVSSGGAILTADERSGFYNFRLKFATSVWSREADKEKAIQFYGMAIPNPLFASNPKALWLLTASTAKACGIKNFTDFVPQPPDLENPKTPAQEWKMMLRDRVVVEPFPVDDDQAHIKAHSQQLLEGDAMPPARRDAAALDLLAQHMLMHMQQIQSKMKMQAAAQAQAATSAPAAGLPGAAPTPGAAPGADPGAGATLPAPGAGPVPAPHPISAQPLPLKTPVSQQPPEQVIDNAAARLPLLPDSLRYQGSPNAGLPS